MSIDSFFILPPVIRTRTQKTGVRPSLDGAKAHACPYGLVL